ncbi:acyloxyacyl hydrolase [bacterium]|nr:MAG: acyloxyacyl hydrolase [bacterium]
MKKKGLILLLAGLMLASPQVSRAEKSPSKALEAIELLTGFGWSKLLEKGNYHVFPVLVAFDFNLKPLTQKINFNPKSLLQFQVEPFASFISSPDNNFETGTNFFLKLGFLPETSKIQPYVKAGAGLDYMTMHSREQSTQFNFTETAGAGLHYFFTDKLALTLEYRYRHLSNAAIKEPNHGINTQFGLAGLTYKF